ncbi:NAD-dependent epimerase/dehydratase family protein [Lutispora saccharofermentans]|uniref:NAD-dependent epimerase/dehydratase family protein n=1 Tax=Lutispora saccharofermentans TaxID=3024236 RepID=A0ABT1NA19_9FIRM|nr:NAD-dependent epimerase/dehydratase family protein [Lutispora saccharofermentans]MCQ1528100.1 NAD-dependent epimerase/dehydratase family protein [Lutispora saccharofermentans]
MGYVYYLEEFYLTRYFDGKRVLITGANGFLGSHIAGRMISQNADLSVIVRESSDLWRIEEHLKNIRIFNADIRDFTCLYECVKKIKPDVIFHMAAYGVDSRQKDAFNAINSNLLGTVNILISAGKAGCPRFINTGTSMQYGNKEGKVDEDSSYTPSNIYGSTKAAATIVAHQLAADLGIDIATIIPFGVFGEKEGSHKFFPQVILSALSNGEINLTSCEQYRDYCYVENIIDGFLIAAQAQQIKSEIFNIGNGFTQPLKYYVDLIIKEVNGAAKINYGVLEQRKNDLWNPLPNVEKINSILGWKPKISIEDGIKSTVSWYKENYRYYEKRGR